MAESRASALWQGDLGSGDGKVSVASGAFPEQAVTWAARTNRPDPKTSPEELIAAAHAACYAMAFSHTLAEAGHAPEQIAVDAACEFGPVEGGGFAITRMDLAVRGRVPASTRPSSSAWRETVSAAALCRTPCAVTSRSASL